jgi:hypothetical protein
MNVRETTDANGTVSEFRSRRVFRTGENYGRPRTNDGACVIRQLQRSAGFWRTKNRTFGPVIAALLIGLFGQSSTYANVIVTAATGGANISADTVAARAWTSLGAITITEGAGSNGDFGAGSSKTLVLALPSGFRFNTAQIPSVSFRPGRDITAASVTGFTTTNLTLTLTVSGTASNDSLTIGATTNLQVVPTAGDPLAAPGNMFCPTSGGGTAVIAGIVTDSTGSAGTSFATLSETSGIATKLAFTTVPGQAVAGNVFGTQPMIHTQDQFGNNSALSLPSDLNVTTALSAGAGSLIGNTNANVGTGAGNGMAAFANLLIDTPGTNDQLTASAAGLAGAVSGIFTVMATQTISFPVPANQVYGAAPFTMSATASSSLAVSFSILSGPATISGNNVTITGVGTVAVQASQAGSSSCSAAANVNQSFSVTTAPLTVSSPNQSRWFGQTNPVFSGIVSGLQYSDNITATFNVTATTNSPVGNYPILPALTDPRYKLANYAVTTNGILSVNPLAVQWTAGNGGNGHYYQAILRPGGISWDAAQTNALNAGGYLATITSSNENNFIFALIRGTPDFWTPDSGGGDGPWVGGVKLSGPLSPTNWTWVTGEAFSYQNWAVGQPNNINGYQDHIQFYSYSGLIANTWNDAANILDEAYVPGYIIEYNSNPYVTNASFSILSAVRSGPANFVITWASTSNSVYRIQSTTDLSLTNWISLTPDVIATNTTASITDGMGTDPRRFYRVLLLHP